MKIIKFLLILLFLPCCIKLSSQKFLITQPKLEFDGYKLTITYDLVAKSKSDIYYVWVELRDQDGDPIRAYSIRGEIGDSINAGNNKVITWAPEEDAIFLNEDVTVEIKSEMFEKEFSKGKMVALSTIVPGLGQTKVKEKPWWLTSIPAYGALAGGIIYQNKYTNTYDKYLETTDDPVERADLLEQSQKENNIAGTLLISAGVIWAANIIWMAATPNKYKPMQHARISLNSMPYERGSFTWLTLKVDF
jgi:hypothetical protein